MYCNYRIHARKYMHGTGILEDSRRVTPVPADLSSLCNGPASDAPLSVRELIFDRCHYIQEIYPNQPSPLTTLLPLDSL